MARTSARRVSFDDLAERRGMLTADDLIGLELTLEYTDVNGEQTRRKVRVIRYYDDRKPTLYCYCYKRRDERSFLLERIGAIIDQNGEVLSAGEFFRLFGLVVFPTLSAPVQNARAVNTTASKGFSALAATEERLSNRNAVRPVRRKLTKVMMAILLAAVLLLIALAA